MSFVFGKNRNRIVVKNCELPGIMRIAKIVAADVESVFGGKVSVEKDVDLKAGDICVTVNPEGFNGKYQCYRQFVEEGVFFITGADLLGGIYGMFRLSEMIGVTPMVYFGDVTPKKQESLEIQNFNYESKQPSVKYRGFFINDEWPCFGTWATSKFGETVNAKCYEVIFEYLLRMNGNFLWPAMWASSFPIDGPGQLNEELATELGVTVSYSHHEPCLRASEEWKRVNGKDTPYGVDWNFDKNEQGLLNYWRDALVRSGKQNHLVTIGMRGEYDSIMLENATLEDNINALKRIILAQKKLINEVGVTLPQTLAIYKEVEQYFYGDEKTKGLMGWEALDDVILMLCEDNHGHMRGLPTKKMREHKGGYGMYFHLDYHGGPVSFEWVNSTSLYQVWEEMTEAYDFGIQDIWIVNVGDVKFNEVPLYYFLQLGYDYEKWGSSNLNSPKEFTEKFVRDNFTGESEEQLKALSTLIDDAYFLNSQRRPETVHSGVYQVCRNLENDRLTNFVEDLEKRAIEINENMKMENRDAYYSLLYWPLLVSTNLYLMWLYTDKNHLYANQGKREAEKYALAAKRCILKDKILADEFDHFKNGKWHGMQLEAHIGFTTWNDFDMRMPVLYDFTPVEKPLLKLSKADDERVYVRVYGRPMRMVIDKVGSYIEISNCGENEIEYTIDGELTGKTAETDILRVDAKNLDGQNHVYTVRGNDGTAVEIETVGFEAAFKPAKRSEYGSIRDLVEKGCIVLTPSSLTSKEDGVTGTFVNLSGYGKYEEGLKVLNRIDDYEEAEKAPSATWEFESPYEGELTAELITAPTNPLKFGGALNVKISLNDGKEEVLNLVPNDFMAGENSDPRWCRDVIAQERRTKFDLSIKKGTNKITITAMEVGVIIERILIHGKTNTH